MNCTWQILDTKAYKKEKKIKLNLSHPCCTQHLSPELIFCDCWMHSLYFCSLCDRSGTEGLPNPVLHVHKCWMLSAYTMWGESEQARKTESHEQNKPISQSACSKHFSKIQARFPLFFALLWLQFLESHNGCNHTTKWQTHQQHKMTF